MNRCGFNFFWLSPQPQLSILWDFCENDKTPCNDLNFDNKTYKGIELEPEDI